MRSNADDVLPQNASHGRVVFAHMSMDEMQSDYRRHMMQGARENLLFPALKFYLDSPRFGPKVTYRILSRRVWAAPTGAEDVDRVLVHESSIEAMAERLARAGFVGDKEPRKSERWSDVVFSRQELRQGLPFAFRRFEIDTGLGVVSVAFCEREAVRFPYVGRMHQPDEHTVFSAADARAASDPLFGSATVLYLERRSLSLAELDTWSRSPAKGVTDTSSHADRAFMSDLSSDPGPSRAVRMSDLRRAARNPKTQEDIAYLMAVHEVDPEAALMMAAEAVEHETSARPGDRYDTVEARLAENLQGIDFLDPSSSTGRMARANMKLQATGVPLLDVMASALEQHQLVLAGPDAPRALPVSDMRSAAGPAVATNDEPVDHVKTEVSTVAEVDRAAETEIAGVPPFDELIDILAKLGIEAMERGPSISHDEPPESRSPGEPAARPVKSSFSFDYPLLRDLGYEPTATDGVIDPGVDESPHFEPPHVQEEEPALAIPPLAPTLPVEDAAGVSQAPAVGDGSLVLPPLARPGPSGSPLAMPPSVRDTHSGTHIGSEPNNILPGPLVPPPREVNDIDLTRNAAVEPDPLHQEASQPNVAGLDF